MRVALALLLPPSIWAVQLFALYGPKAIFCSRGYADLYIPYAVLVSLLTIGALGLMARIRITSGASARFIDGAALALCLLSICAAVWVALPVVMIRACV